MLYYTPKLEQKNQPNLNPEIILDYLYLEIQAAVRPMVLLEMENGFDIHFPISHLSAATGNLPSRRSLNVGAHL